jgi:pimeloyl-ACP methyl ester carboxylesterase
MRDPAFGPPALARWEEVFGPGAHVLRLPEAGHWPHEEAPEAVGQELRAFLTAT